MVLTEDIRVKMMMAEISGALQCRRDRVLKDINKNRGGLECGKIWAGRIRYTRAIKHSS